MRACDIYPLKLRPIYKETVWGGSWLTKNFGKQLPSSKIGESWELVDRVDAVTIIENGYYAEKKLIDVLKKNKNEYLGENFEFDRFGRFPIMLKYIDAAEKLSVQVHPSERYTKLKKLEDSGKNEFWYILNADRSAKIILGLQSKIDIAKFKEKIKKQNSEIEKELNYINIKTGDFFYIPAGLIHAILGGVRIAEIQQNSDLTFRIYDWQRCGLDGKPRKLHITEALETINFKNQTIYKLPKNNSVADCIDYQYKKLLNSRYFKIFEYRIFGKSHFNKRSEKFEIFMIFQGSASLIADDKLYNFNSGETWFLSA
ncbi:MAG TPA: class I mannose-6-phosphate isomerase [bacterium]|nr:class I mannose-6-phosphate isomerase [bacterium]